MSQCRSAHKVVPQELLHDTYNVPNIRLEELDTEGFLSFDEIRRKRPSLYVKYWDLWTRHMKDRKDFYLKWKDDTENRWEKVNKYAIPPNWDEFLKCYNHRGVSNKPVPIPSIEMVSSKNFDPWEYMESFRESESDILIPPYFIDYANPLQYRQRPFPNSDRMIQPKDLDKSPARTRHYKWPAQSFISYLENGHEWDMLLNY